MTQTSPDTSHTNRLIDQTSPYLLQHAHNPVDWHPWNEEALDKARAENKPILLSIGYSACHWCHVMAHESFEDAATAKVMNELFVNIKVDREERPDLDKIYQTAHHLLTQRSGGWPLTMFLTPEDQTPFFGGTYFPPEPRHGMPSFTDLMRHVEGFYRERRGEIDTQNSSLIRALAQTQPATQGSDLILDAQPLDSCRYQLEKNFDTEFGGFGGAPKFPHPTSIDSLLRHWAATRQQDKEDTRSLEMARFSLHAMASGGIYDQLGGGFCRYSVDERWMIPHFEKMLYDNAQLLPLYAQAHLATGDTTFRRIAQETAAWVIREMQAPDGGYYSTLDADSEGVEGKFYAWTPDEVRGLLTENEYAAFAPRFGLDRHANFEDEWHLHVFTSNTDTAAKLGKTENEINALLASASAKLFAAREQRIRPGRDEKILTAWNGLMIKGMAAAGRLLDNEDYIRSAEHALDFVKSTLWQEGRLLATCKDDRAHLNAYLDDYVFLIEGTLELLQARWRDTDLAFAIELTEVVLEHFEDKKDGGFFFTADDHEQLIHRPKPVADDAIPAGNGVAVFVLQRLGHLLGDARYLNAAERALKAAWSNISQVPYAHNSLLIALEEYIYPTQTIVLRGETDAMQPWLQQCTQDYVPRRFSIAIPDDAKDLPALLKERSSIGGKVTAYVCSGHSCQAPVTDPEQYRAIL